MYWHFTYTKWLEKLVDNLLGAFFAFARSDNFTFQHLAWNNRHGALSPFMNLSLVMTASIHFPVKKAWRNINQVVDKWDYKQRMAANSVETPGLLDDQDPSVDPANFTKTEHETKLWISLISPELLMPFTRTIMSNMQLVSFGGAWERRQKAQKYADDAADLRHLNDHNPSGKTTKNKQDGACACLVYLKRNKNFVNVDIYIAVKYSKWTGFNACIYFRHRFPDNLQ